jgi:hypothetical protein
MSFMDDGGFKPPPGGVPLQRKGPVPIGSIVVDPEQFMAAIRVLGQLPPVLNQLLQQIGELHMVMARTTPCQDCGKVWGSDRRCAECSQAYLALPEEVQEAIRNEPVAGPSSGAEVMQGAELAEAVRLLRRCYGLALRGAQYATRGLPGATDLLGDDEVEAFLARYPEP